MTVFRLILVMTTALQAGAQTLSIGTAPASPGHNTLIAIFLESQPGKPVVAAQWDLEFPAGLLRMEIKDIGVGDAARKAGKSVTCGGRWKKTGVTYSYRCVLAGGRELIESGPVAVIRPAVLPDVKPGKSKLRLSGGLSVDADLKRTEIDSSEATLVIR